MADCKINIIKEYHERLFSSTETQDTHRRAKNAEPMMTMTRPAAPNTIPSSWATDIPTETATAEKKII